MTLADTTIARHSVTLPEALSALSRLMMSAQGCSGQCRHVAAFLLSLYDGHRFPVDITALRVLDGGLLEDCLTVLEADARGVFGREIHLWLVDGAHVFERLAMDWEIGRT